MRQTLNTLEQWIKDLEEEMAIRRRKNSSNQQTSDETQFTKVYFTGQCSSSYFLNDVKLLIVFRIQHCLREMEQKQASLNVLSDLAEALSSLSKETPELSSTVSELKKNWDQIKQELKERHRELLVS